MASEGRCVEQRPGSPPPRCAAQGGDLVCGPSRSPAGQPCELTAEERRGTFFI